MKYQFFVFYNGRILNLSVICKINACKKKKKKKKNYRFVQPNVTEMSFFGACKNKHLSKLISLSYINFLLYLLHTSL